MSISKNRISCVYKIYNLVDNKFYIGSTIDFNGRKKTHFGLLKKNIHSNEFLQNSFNKYSEENFLMEIIEVCQPEERVIREQYYIDNLVPHYNISKLAHTIELNQATRDKISIAHKGTKKPKTKQHIENHALSLRGKPSKNKGVRLTIEQKVFISEKTKLGMKLSNASEKISKAKIGTAPWNKGIKIEEEKLINHKASMKNRNSEWSNNISKNKLGKQNLKKRKKVVFFDIKTLKIIKEYDSHLDCIDLKLKCVKHFCRQFPNLQKSKGLAYKEDFINFIKK